ncbi:MAG: RNA-guided endonuclease InsQ/TnpB family protein [Cyanobacterium sp.]
MATRRYTFRLYPNKAQEVKLLEARRLHAYLYNACIADRKYQYSVNKKSVSYFEQQNCLPQFKDCWIEYKSLHSQSLQATVKRVDLAYNSFLLGIRKRPRFKSIRDYSGWTYPAKSGWKANTNGKHGSLTLNDLKVILRMRGQAKVWGVPTTLTIVYRPYLQQWFASITVNVPDVQPKYGSESELEYKEVVAWDVGCLSALTLYDGKDFREVENPRFTQRTEQQIKKESKKLRRKRSPNHKKKVKGSNRWREQRKKISQLQRKCANQRKDWQHQVTSEIASRYDLGVTEKLNVKGMTRKAKISKGRKQKAGLNKSILSVGFGELNNMLTYKIEEKGGIVLQLNTKKIKPSQRCPQCGTVHKEWAVLSNRYHVCECGFESGRDESAAMVMYNVAVGKQLGLGIRLTDADVASSVSKTRKHTGSMRKLGQMKRQSSIPNKGEVLETPPSTK